MTIVGFVGVQELMLIIVVALIIFGGGKLAGVGKSLGKSVREFKEEIHHDDEEPSSNDDTDEMSHK